MANTSSRACTVAHVNYLFLASTESFIYSFLSHHQRVRPICLTRAPEAKRLKQPLPAALAQDFYLYGAPPGARALCRKLLRPSGVALRGALAHAPPGVSAPILDFLNTRVVPRLRSEANGGHFLEWSRGILRQRDARLIHAYLGPIGWRMLTLKRELKLPLIVTFLGDDVVTALEPWWWWWIQDGAEDPDWPARLRELLDEADLFLVEGPFLRQRLIDLGCSPAKVEVQRIGIPVRQMSCGSGRSSENGKIIILFAGRFCEQKGVLDALEAVREIWDERRDIEFRLIGDEQFTDGKYAARIHAYIRRHRLHGCVRLLGFLNYADYLRELEQADIFLHPSTVGEHGISEGGAPTTILEAQALGIPVVSTYHCDIPNVTVPGESALLVAERDSRALADALRTLLRHPDRRKAMGRAGRRHIERYHDIEREVVALEDRYLALLGRGTPRTRVAG